MEWWQKLEDFWPELWTNLLSDSQTLQEIEFIEKNIPLEKSFKILDLACGDGRHSIELAKRGYQVVCFDYSQKLLDTAKKAAKKDKVKIDTIKGDMRFLSFRDEFDVAISMYQSFGYFKLQKDDENTIGSVSKALKAQGKFLIDLRNPVPLMQNLGSHNNVFPKQEILLNGWEIESQEWFDSQSRRYFTHKKIKKNGAIQDFEYFTRLYELRELEEMLGRSGFTILSTWGDFNSEPYQLETSRRLIILAQKYI